MLFIYMRQICQQSLHKDENTHKTFMTKLFTFNTLNVIIIFMGQNLNLKIYMY